MTNAAIQTTPHEPHTQSIWSPERRARQSAMMRAKRIWEKSTGPKTTAGKAASSRNAFKHGSYSALERELSRLLRENGRMLTRINSFIRLEASLKKSGSPYDRETLWPQVMSPSPASTGMTMFIGNENPTNIKISRNELLNTNPFSANSIRNEKDKGAKTLSPTVNIDQICKIRYNNGMDEETRKLLVSAWRENRLMGLHIDAQWIYSNDVFHAIGTLAQGLRERAVPNTWVAWPDHERHVDIGITTVAAYHDTNQDEDYYLSRHVGAQDDEALLTKNAQSAFATLVPHLERYLDSKNVDTFVITGVGGRNACADKTIKSAILMDKYNVVALTDCINNTGDDYRDHIRNITRKHPDAFERRYHEATSAEILNALRNPSAP